MNNEGLENLASQIRALKKPSCEHLKLSLKERLISTISNEGDLFPGSLLDVAEIVRTSAASVQLDVNKKARIKNSIFDRIEVIKNTFWHTFGRMTALFTPLVLVSFLFVYVLMFESVILDKNIVKATVIADIQGNVYVVRDGKRIVAYENMELKERDIISTDNESRASIQYLDDSVSRLDEDSSVVVNKLFSHSKKKTFTVVEVEVVRGDVWNKVVNLVDDGGSHFKVRANGVSTRVSKKAAFNVTADEDSGDVKVKVLESTVNIENENVHLGDESGMKNVSEGYEAIVEMPQKMNSKKEIVIDRNVENVSEKKWIAMNLVKDEDYVKKIVKKDKQQRKKIIGSLPHDALYSVKQIKSDVTVLFAGGKIKKEKLKFEIAHRRLEEAQVMLGEGDFEGAEKLLDEFKGKANKFSEFIDELEESDPKQALDLKIELNDRIDGSIKELEIISEADPLNKVKQVLRETDDLIANKVEESVNIVEVGHGKKQDESDPVEDDVLVIDHSVEKQIKPVVKVKRRLKNVVEIEQNNVVAPQVFTPGGIDLVDKYDLPKKEKEEKKHSDLKVVAPQVFTPEGVNLVSED